MRKPKRGDLRTTHDEGLICDVEIYDELRYGDKKRTRAEIVAIIGENSADNYISFRRDEAASAWRWIGQIHQSQNTERVLFVSSDDTLRQTFESFAIAIEELMILGQRGRL